MEQLNRDRAMEDILRYCLGRDDFSGLLNQKDISINDLGCNLDLYCRFFIHFVLRGVWSVKSESYLVPEESLNFGGDMKRGFRKHDVRTPCFLVYGEKNEVKVSTSDVIHS